MGLGAPSVPYDAPQRVASLGGMSVSLNPLLVPPPGGACARGRLLGWD